MEIVYNDAELDHYMEHAVDAQSRTPCFSRPLPHRKRSRSRRDLRWQKLPVIPGIMEHIEEREFTQEILLQYIIHKRLLQTKLHTRRLYQTFSKGLKVGFNEYSVCNF